MYKIKLTKTARSNFKKLDKRYQKSVSKAFNRLAQNPSVGDPLKGKLKGYWRLRFSRYRIVYKIYRKQLLILIFDISHRKDIYR
jgi:mRNA interferase RelE/StbE